MNFFDLRHPFFNPLWRRVLTVAFSGGWAIVEFVSGSPGWAMLFAALALWCAYEFFVNWQPQDELSDDDPEEGDE